MRADGSQKNYNMKKKVLLSLYVMFSTVAFAQTTPSATLYHGEEFKIFHSADGLQDAMDLAVDGDVITLSPGVFNAVDITKPITIRGAGMGTLSSDLKSEFQTIIAGEYIIDIPAGDSNKSLYIEGVYHDQSTVKINNAENAMLVKSRFYNLNLGGKQNCSVKNITFFHVFTDGELQISSGVTSTAQNSIFKAIRAQSNQYSFYYTNCVLISESTQLSLSRSYLRNCISNMSMLSTSNNVAVNCLYIGDLSGIRGNEGGNNKCISQDKNIFKTESYYRLTEESMDLYKGDDGTQIGIYGGDHPFSLSTTYPQLKNFKVAPQTTTDGKLRIEFEIEAL